MRTYLDFEKPVADLEGKAAELKALGGGDVSEAIKAEVKQLENKAETKLIEIYANLNPWQETMVARHPGRPHFLDYVAQLFEEFTPLSGDRKYGEDKALVGGFARFHGEAVMIMGHEKGSDTEGRLRHNFGMARPEGYRKAVRLMELADKFDIPVISFIDTAGAYPGIGAEERGQSEAIARSTDCCLALKVPHISVIIGEGGSGGAVAIATANEILMLEHSIYSVASPEASASILWRDSARAEDAAKAMKVSSNYLKEFGVVDTIIAEPVGGAHREPVQAILQTGNAIAEALQNYTEMSREEILEHRREKFLKIGRNL